MKHHPESQAFPYHMSAEAAQSTPPPVVSPGQQRPGVLQDIILKTSVVRNLIVGDNIFSIFRSDPQACHALWRR